MNKRISFIAVLISFSLLALAAVAFASEGAGHEPTFTFVGDWLPGIINFSALAIVLFFLLRKPTREAFRSRSAEIGRALQESKEARERAVAALADMERKIREMEAEARSMVAEAETRGEKDKQALLEEGKKLAKDIQEQVKTGVEIEVQKARADLAAEASLLAIELAEGKLKGAVGKPDHERMVKEYISNVGGRG